MTDIPGHRPEGFVFISDAELLKALVSTAPLDESVIDNLVERLNEWDCENWDVEIGLAIVERLRRRK